MLTMKINSKKRRKMLADNRKEKGKSTEEFVEYMVKYQKDMMKASMIASGWDKHGLGKPPAEYTQNSNKSINSILKKWKSVSKLTLKDTFQLMKSEVEIQKQKKKQKKLSFGVMSRI